MKDKVTRFVFGKTLAKIERFRNIHKGESCYIFGNGPSIKWFDLDLFNDYPAISCGLIHYHKDFHKLNIKYAVMVEPWIYVPRIIRSMLGVSKLYSSKLYETRLLAAEYKNFIKRNLDKEFFLNVSNILSLSGENVNYVFRGFPENRNPADKLLSHFNLFPGSFHASLAIAYYLGFSNIYLIGFDAWSIQPTRNIRFYEFGKGELEHNTPGKDELLEIYKSEANIYTISVNGNSTNVLNIDYQDYTNIPAVYKENHEIVNDHYLQMLRGVFASRDI